MPFHLIISFNGISIGFVSPFCSATRRIVCSFAGVATRCSNSVFLMQLGYFETINHPSDNRAWDGTQSERARASHLWMVMRSSEQLSRWEAQARADYAWHHCHLRVQLLDNDDDCKMECEILEGREIRSNYSSSSSCHFDFRRDNKVKHAVR